MSNKHKQINEKFDARIEECLDFADQNAVPDTDQFNQTIANAEKLVKVKNDYNSQKVELIGKAVGAFVSIAVPVSMMAFEAVGHVITTKSLNFWQKPRI